MSGITDFTFDQVRVISSSTQPLTIVTGIAAFTLQGDRNDDFDRGDINFPVPRDNAESPLIIDRAFEKQMTVIAYPATIENRGGGGANLDGVLIALQYKQIRKMLPR